MRRISLKPLVHFSLNVADLPLGPGVFSLDATGSPEVQEYLSLNAQDSSSALGFVFTNSVDCVQSPRVFVTQYGGYRLSVGVFRLDATESL